MDAQSEESLHDRLQELKERSGLSLRTIADEMGYSQASSIQRYFSADYPDKVLPANFIGKLLDVLPGRGSPAITREEILAFASDNVAEIIRKTTVPDTRKAVFPTCDGDVTIIYPAQMSAEGYADLEKYISVFLSQGRS